MTKLDELIQQLCPDGVKYYTLNTVCNVYDGTHKTPKYTDSGIKFASVENIADPYATEKYISISDYEKYKIKPQRNDLLMTRIGSIGVCTVLESDEPLAYYVSLALLRPNNNELNSRYLKYAIESLHCRKELRKRTLVNAVPIKINMGDIGKITLPVPPLPVQREIVRILDNFTELTAELTARKQQYAYYRNSLLSFEYRENSVKKALSEIAEISTGSSNTDEAVENGQYPFYVRSQQPLAKNEYEFDEEAVITAGDGVGVGKVFHYVSGKYALHQRAYRIHPTSNSIMCKYLYYYFVANFPKYIGQQMYQGSVPSIRRPMLNQFEVSVPSPEVQKRLVEVLDNFDAICTDLNIGLPAEIEARQKQYEYYRDKLLTFTPAD